MASAYDRIKASRRKFHESAGLTDQDIANFQQNYVASQDGAQLLANVEEAKTNLIASPPTVRSHHTALANYNAALNRLNTFVSLGGQVNGVDDRYMQSLYDQYNQSQEQLNGKIRANYTAHQIPGLAEQAQRLSQERGMEITPARLMGQMGLVDADGNLTQAGQEYWQRNAYIQGAEQSGQESARWGAQNASDMNELESVRYWQDIVRKLPQTGDARVKTSNDEWLRQAAAATGITSYTDAADLSAQLAARESQLRAKSGWSERMAGRNADQQLSYRAALYQIDNPDESIEANYYLALRDQAGRDAKTVDGFMDFLETPQEIGNWLRYNSAYGNQLYQDQKNEDILAIRSDPTVGPIYQEAMEAARGSGQVSSLRAQVHGEMRDNGSISPETEAAVREMAQAAGITVGQGDAALEAALEQMHQQYSHTVNTNMARMQAQGYDPERLRQYIQQALNEQRMDEQNAAAREFAAERPGAASVGSSLTNVLSGGGYLATAPQAVGNAIAGLTGNYENYIPIDPNSEAFSQSQYVTAVRDEVSRQIVENGGDDLLYGVGMSILDNMVQMAVGAMTLGLPAAAGATGQGARAAIQAGVQAASPVTLATMGLGAASQELVKLTEQGTPSDQAYALATVLGGLEILTEKIGIDALVGNLGKQYAGNLLQQIVMMAAKQSAAEGMEEVIAEAGGVFADWLIRQEDSDIMQTIEAGRMNGLTESEALWGAFREYGKQVLEAGAAGALSGLFFGAGSTVGVVADAASPAATGSRIRAEGNEEALGAMATAFGVEYSPEMSDRQIGKTYRAVRKAGAQLHRDMQFGMSMASYAREKGYDARTTKALERSWDAYHSVYGNNMSSREFAATWNSVKAAGQANMRFEDAVAELGETSLSQRTLENAWKAGQKLYVQAQRTAKAQPVAAQEIAQQKTEAAVETVAELSESAPAVTQLVERDSESAAGHAQSLMGERINVNGLSDEQVDALFDESDSDISTERKGALAMARMLTGVSKNINQVILVDNAEVDAEGHMRLSNGMWDPTNRTITIDINAGRTNVEQQATFMTRTMSHEVTHSIKTTAPKQYAELERFVLREMDKQANLEALIEAKIADYAKYGIALDRQGAVDELVAEACEQMLERTEVLNKLAQENRTLWEKIRDYIKNAIAKLKALYKGMKANSPEARMLQGVIDELQAKWDAAFEASLTVESLETENNEAMSPAQEIQHSLARNEELSELARVVNEKDGFVAARTLSNATSDRQKIADMMRENIDKYGNSYGLPPDLEGDTFLADGSYSGSEENSTICVRSMAHEAMLDSVSELLGRPLTVQESIFVGQDLLTRTNIGMRMECTYCYVATDRKGYREFLAKYLQQRDAVLEKYRNGMTDTSRTGKLYKDFLNKRKDTDNMWDRFSMWIELEKNGAPMMKSSDLANVAKMIRGDYDQELKPQIEDAMKYAQGASWAKKRMSYTAYNGHILKWTLDKINALNSHYGLRMYSFSDFSPAFILENMQMFVDAAVRGLKVLAYTKELDFVKIFAKTGANINISCFGMDVGGNVVEDSIQGAAWEEAQKLRAKHPNVGITFVATNDALVEWALAQEWIDVVIPFHLVRTGKELAKQLGFEDYTKESSDKKVRGKHIGQKKAAALGIEADENSISPVEHDNDFDKYMAALKENHLRPRFERWIKNPNYMKLVNECRQSASESQPVQPVFDLEAAKDSLNSLIGQGGYYVPYGGSVERQYELATEIADKISAGEATAAAKKAQVEWDEKHPKKPRKSKVQHQINRGERMAKLFDNGGVELNEYEVAGALWDAMDHGDAGDDNLIRIGQMPKYVTNLLGITGDFYIYRDHSYENMVSKEDAIAAGRPVVRNNKNIHFHELGVDGLTDAIMSVERPLITIKESKKTPEISMVLPVLGKNNAPLYAVLRFYDSQAVKGMFTHRPHILLTVSDRPYENTDGRIGTVDVVRKAYEERRIIDMVKDKKMRDSLSVIAQSIKLGNVTEASLNASLTQFRKEIKDFKDKNKIYYQVSRDTASDMDLLMGASMDGLSKAEADHLLRYRDRVNEIRQNQRKIDELKAEELTADVNAQIKRLENANSIIYRKVNAAEQTDLMQRIIEQERAAGDVEVQRMDNRVADLEDEIDDLGQKIRNAKLAGQMAQGRQDAATLRKTVADYEQRLEVKRRQLKIARQSRDKKIAQMQESRRKGIEDRQRAVFVHKIRNIAKDLRQRTLRPTNGRYVPGYLVNAVVDVANMIDDAPGAGTKARVKYDNMRAALKELKEQYDGLERDTDPDYNYEYDREFSLLIKELADSVGNTPVAKMTNEQVEDVYSILRDIRYTLIDAVHQIGTLERITNYETGTAIIEEMQSVAAERKLLGEFGNKAAGLALSPLRNVHKMTGYRQDSVLMELFNAMNEGIRRQNMFTMEANQIFDSLRDGKNAGKFSAACNDVVDFDLTDVDGKPVRMTRMEAMQIILSAEREAANKDLIHIQTSGVRIADPSLMRKGRVSEAISKGQEVMIGPEQLQKLRDGLEQWDKDFMDAARRFFNEKSKDAINETSMQLKHRKLATGKAYIPFHVDQNFVNREIEGLKIDSTIEGAGSLKSLSKKATQPLIITGLNHIIEDHISFVGKYYGLAIPIKNFNKAYNVKKVGSNLSVKRSIDAVWGKTGQRVIEDTVRDLQKSRTRANDILSKGLQTLQSSFVKAALLSNISVTIKQAASYSTAGLLLSQRALAPYQATVARLFGNPNSKYAKNLFAEIDAHTAQHWIRRKGLSTQELGDYVQRQGRLAEFDRKLPASLNPIKWIQNMDVATTAALWLAAKNEISHIGNYTENSDEYWAAVTELYDQVIEQTQPMYDVMHRPEVQKTTNELVRQMVMFRTQPLQNTGVIYDAFGELAAANASNDAQWKRDASKKARRAAFSQVASLTVFATMTMIAGAVTHRLSRYRDDDEELTVLSVMLTMLGDIGQNAAGVLIPVGGAELYDVIVNKLIGSSRYETVAIPVAGVINDYIDALSKVTKGFEEQAQADDPDWGAAWMNVLELGKLTAELFGIPANNVEKILVGFYENAKDIAAGNFPAFNNDVERENSVNYRRLYQALADGDMEKFDEVYAEVSGNLSADGEEDVAGAIASGLQKQIKDAYLDGELTDEEATEFLVNYVIELSAGIERQHDTGTITDEEYMTMLENEAYWTLKGWNARVEDSDAYTSKYADLRAVIEAGGDSTAAVEELLAHGETEDDVSSGASSIIADLYKNGEIDAATAEEYLAEYADITDSKDLYTWFTEKDHWIETGESNYGAYGPVWDALREGGDATVVINAMVEAGWTEEAIAQNIRTKTREWVLGTATDGYTVSPTEARSILSKYGGVDDDDLDGYVNAYEFWLDNPDYVDDFTVDQANKYLEFGTGIDLDVFIEYREAIADMDGEQGADGKTISGSRKAEVMAYINTMPITNAQKDQLYYMNGWKSTTIYEAPWH